MWNYNVAITTFSYGAKMAPRLENAWDYDYNYLAPMILITNQMV